MQVILTSPIPRSTIQLIDTLNLSGLSASIKTSILSSEDRVVVIQDDIQLTLVPSPGNRVFLARISTPTIWKMAIIGGFLVLGSLLLTILIGEINITLGGLLPIILGNYFADKFYEGNNKQQLLALIQTVKECITSEYESPTDFSNHLIES